MNMTPQQRLTASRRSIVQSMNRDRQEQMGDDLPEGSHASAAFGEHENFEGATNTTRSARQHSSGLNGLWRTVRRATSAWWRSHPAHLAVDVVHPMFEKYAQDHPLKLVSAAAVIGAAVVIAKPWRLISVTSVLIAAMRSTQMSSLVASFLTSPPERSRDR